MNPRDIARQLAAMQTEQLAEVYDLLEEESLLLRIEPLIKEFRALDLSIEQTETLCTRLKHIAWCAQQRLINNNKGEKL